MRFRPLAAIVLLSGFGTFSGCLTARDTAVPEENGFWTREGRACTRVIASPVLALWGLATMGEEFCVGCWEIVSGQECGSVARPMELLSDDVVAVPVEVENCINPLSEFMTEKDKDVLAACDDRNWSRAAETCRRRLARSEGALEKILNGTQLAMINWNAGDRIGAVIAMDTVIVACGSVGEESRAFAQQMRAEFRTGNVTDSFSIGEVTKLKGRRKALAEIVLRESARRVGK